MRDSDYADEKARINMAIDQFADAMRQRMFVKLNHGYAGWDNPEKISSLDIAMAMHDDIDYDHPDWNAVDIANRAMMLWYRAK